ncbi:MFS multidrug transporter, partial [Trichophyton equinum CBS 127.97]
STTRPNITHGFCLYALYGPDQKLEMPKEGDAAHAEFCNLDDQEDPKKWPMLQKWKAIARYFVLCSYKPSFSNDCRIEFAEYARDLSITRPAEQVRLAIFGFRFLIWGGTLGDLFN